MFQNKLFSSQKLSNLRIFTRALIVQTIIAAICFGVPAYSDNQQLSLPISQIVRQSSLSLCQTEDFFKTEYDFRAATAGLKIFKSGLTEEFRAGGRSLKNLVVKKKENPLKGICLPELTIDTDTKFAVRAETTEHIEVSLGTESVLCSDSRSYLRADLNNTDLYSTQQILTNQAQKIKNSKIISAFKRRLIKLKSLSRNRENEVLIYQTLYQIEKAKLLSDYSYLLINYYDSICSQSKSVNLPGSKNSELSNDDRPQIPVISNRTELIESVFNSRTGNAAISVIYPENNADSAKLQSRAVYRTYNVTWTAKVNGVPFRINHNVNYPAGTYVRLYLTDFDYIDKNGFFKGWSGAPCKEAIGNPKARECSFYVFNNTQVETDYYDCATTDTRTAYFDSVKSLERKLVLLARNNPDSALKLKASGEVAALAITYPSGGVCAKFFEGQTGLVSLSYGEIDDFMWPYRQKGIFNLNNYHTHDGNSSRNPDAIISWGVDDKGKWVGPPGTIPSIQDFLEDYKTGKTFSRFFNITSKGVSSAGNGYTYAIGIDFNPVKFQRKVQEFLDRVLEIKFRSVNKKLTAYPHIKDIQAALDYSVKEFKKSGLILKPFKIS